MAKSRPQDIVQLPPGFGTYFRRRLEQLRRREIVSSFSLQNDFTTSDKILPIQELLLEGTPEDAIVRAYLALGEVFPEPAPLLALYTGCRTKRKALILRYAIDEFEAALRANQIPYLQIAVATLVLKARQAQGMEDPVQQLVEYAHQFPPAFTADITAKDALERPLRVVLAASDLPGDVTAQKAAEVAARLKMTKPTDPHMVRANLWEKAVASDWRRELLGRRPVNARQAYDHLQTFIACVKGIDRREIEVEYRNIPVPAGSLPGEPVGLILEADDEAEPFGIWLRNRRMLQFYVSLKDRVLLPTAMQVLDFFDVRPRYDRTDYAFD